jgi:hypothetical protein
LTEFYGAPSGVSPAVATEADADTVSPNALFKAQDFYVQKTGGALATGDFLQVEFVVGGVPNFVCTIFLTASCTGPAAPITVPADSTISIQLRFFSLNGDPPFDLLFGWRATS